jgi:hypothetical protein
LRRNISRVLVAGIDAGDGVDHPLLGCLLRRGLDVARACPRASVDGDRRVDQIADDLFHVAPDIAHFGELGRLDLQERRRASFARRRLISVLPTPVGPIIRMFFG